MLEKYSIQELICNCGKCNKQLFFTAVLFFIRMYGILFRSGKNKKGVAEMQLWKKNLLFVWLSQICSLAGFASIMPFIPLYIKWKFGVTDEGELGVQVALFNFFGMLSFCLAAPLWGYLADKYGRKLMILRSCFVSAAVFPTLIFAPDIVLLTLGRFVMSAFSGTVTAAQTFIASNTPEEHQGFALGTLSTSIWSGHLFGFMIGSAVVHYFGFYAGFLAGSCLLALAGLLALLFVKEDFVPLNVPQEKTEKRSFFASLTGWDALIWIIMALFIMMGLARRFDEPYLPIMLERFIAEDRVVPATGLINAVVAVGGIISGVTLGKLCDKVGAMRVAYPVIIVAGACAFVQAAAMNVIPFAVARFITYTAAGGLEPVFQTMLSKAAPPEKRGTLFGLVSSLRMTGILCSALLAGGVIWMGGVRAVYYVTACLFVLLLPLTWFSDRFRRRNMAQ